MREKTKKTFKIVLENAKMFKFSKQTMKILDFNVRPANKICQKQTSD